MCTYVCVSVCIINKCLVYIWYAGSTWLYPGLQITLVDQSSRSNEKQKCSFFDDSEMAKLGKQYLAT